MAKLVEVLFSSSILTDVGCTMRLIHRDAYEKIKDRLTVGGSHFGLEMTLVCLTSDLSVTEIPVNYCRRVGVSSVTGDRMKAIALGARMGLMVLGRAVTDKLLAGRHRIPSTTRRAPPAAAPGPADGPAVAAPPSRTAPTG
jgi:hypothetical protein